MQTEREIQVLIDANLDVDAPILPEEKHWRMLAILKLRGRLTAYANLTKKESVLMATLDGLSRHPAFKNDAERVLVACERAWRNLEIEALKKQLDEIDASVWGLSSAHQRRARMVGGMEAAPRGVGIANFNHAEELKALQIEAGALVVAGFIDDLRKQAALRKKIEQAESELAAIMTDSERAVAERKTKVAAAKADAKATKQRADARAALATAEA